MFAARGSLLCPSGGVFKFSEISIRRVNDSSIPDTFVLDEKSQLSGASIFSPMSI